MLPNMPKVLTTTGKHSACKDGVRGGVGEHTTTDWERVGRGEWVGQQANMLVYNYFII